MWNRMLLHPPDPGDRILICSGSQVMEAMATLDNQIVVKQQYELFNKVFPHRLVNGWMPMPTAPGHIAPPPQTDIEAALDKKTHQKVTETDNDLYNARLIAACCQDPNFKDAELQEKYGVRGAEALINLILKPHQFLDLLIAVNEVNGFQDDINDLKDTAKN